MHPSTAAKTAEEKAAAAAAIDAAEQQRLEAVRATGLIGVEAGERLDRIARQAAQIAGAPLALVSLIDEHRQWNPGVHGEDAPREAPRGFSMCSAAIASPDPYVVPDASKDPDWADVPGINSAPHVRFYAGQPIDDGKGNMIGVLCVIDTVPREADAELLQTLADLAVWARHELLSGRVELEGADAEATTTPSEEQPAADASVSTGQAATDRLQELERLQSLVVSTTAHELRTPLTVLRVHADLLAAAAAELGPEERASLDAITRAVTRLQDVSDGLVADLRGSAGGAEEALRRWLQLEEGSQRIRPIND
ncbi:GAF domain-containing protein [Patulibacter minatonensis]|uniref:sensor histidine kinase n=1 Tax=Patulibacter minatonensis TaxID=298163 RepID=UPI000687C5AB|nr:GAF domain-containing protein [Patulibacter minatonensis]